MKSKKKKKKEKKEKKREKDKRKSDYIVTDGLSTPTKEQLPPSLAATPASYKTPVAAAEFHCWEA